MSLTLDPAVLASAGMRTYPATSALKRRLRPREIARALRIRDDLVYQAIRSGELPAYAQHCGQGKPRFWVVEKDAKAWAARIFPAKKTVLRKTISAVLTI